MDRDTFATRLVDSARAARDFARRQVVEELPDAIRFHVHLNASSDGNQLHLDERAFPDDSNRGLFCCDEEGLARALWRDAAVPEWINLEVDGRTEHVTTILATCCGRFTPNDQLLYHAREGRPPFHVLGPTLPAGWTGLGRFSLHHRATCVSPDELEYVCGRAALVRTLEAHEAATRTDLFTQLPAFPHLASLVAAGVASDTAWVAAAARHPMLVQIILERRGPYALRAVDLPPLRDFSIACDDRLGLEGAFPDTIEDLSIRAARLTSVPRLPPALNLLRLHVRATTEARLVQLLRTAGRIRSLQLDGTNVSEPLAMEAAGVPGLETLGLARTRLSHAAIDRVRAAHPQLRVWPKALPW